MKFCIIFFIVLLIFSFFLFFYSTLSHWESFEALGESGTGNGGEDGGEEKVCVPCFISYYQCLGACEGELQEMLCEVCCGGGCGPWVTIQKCFPWQICDASVPNCHCQGECLETPESPRYYNNPTYSDQPNKDVGNKNIYLPVKLDWDDVEGWGKADGPQSYRIEIKNARPISSFETAVQDSSFIPPSCTLKSNSSHSWGVRACCTLNGDNCGEKSNWRLETNIAPEPVSPADPDWVGEERKEDVSIPTKLDWCDVEEAQSYFLKINKDGKLYYPFPIEKVSTLDSEITLGPIGTLNSKITLGPEVITKFSTYDWMVATCLNENGTKCGTECSSKQDGQQCGTYSQRWGITTGEIALPTPEIISPTSTEAIPVVNLASNLGWKAVAVKGVLSYHYEVEKKGIVATSSSVSADTTSVSFESFWKSLEFNQTYSWTVRSCWDEEGKNCEEERSESTFKTTGAPPTFKEYLSGPANGAVDVLVPVNLNWDDMPGAASYYYEISPLIPEEERVAKVSDVLVDYPILKQEENYQWRVKTCADREGKICGAPATQSFTTIRLAAPTNPVPENGGRLPTTQKNIEWGKVLGANFYQYNVSQGKIEGISPANSAFLPTEKLDLGNHTWQVRACLDKDCKETGSWSNWNFTLAQREDCETGFVPCGRDCDVAETSWNEREPCGFKHIFLIFKNILDFLLWRLAPITLVLLALGTGVIFYFSMGAPGTIINVKAIWRSAGIGFAIIFLAWNILNFILNLLGFTIKWWEFPF